MVVVVGTAAVVDTGLDAGLLEATLGVADVVVAAAELVACAADGEDDAAEEDAAGAEVVTGAALVGVVVGVAVCVDVAADAGDWLLVGAPLVAVVLLGDALVAVCSADVDAGVDVAAEVESLGDGAVGTLVGGAGAGTSSAAVSGTV